jgi:hypothetical protein
LVILDVIEKVSCEGHVFHYGLILEFKGVGSDLCFIQMIEIDLRLEMRQMMIRHPLRCRYFAPRKFRAVTASKVLAGLLRLV